MRDLILQYIHDAESGHLKDMNEQPLSPEQRKLVVGILQMLIADADFKNLL